MFVLFYVTETHIQWNLRVLNKRKVCTPPRISLVSMTTQDIDNTVRTTIVVC